MILVYTKQSRYIQHFYSKKQLHALCIGKFQSVFQTVYMTKYKQSNKHKQNKCLRNNKLFFF